MGDEITIDKVVFHDRLSSFINQWKNDRRAGDALFNGADSIVLLVGKASEANTYNKTTAFQVSQLVSQCNFRLIYLLSCGYLVTSFLQHFLS